MKIRHIFYLSDHIIKNIFFLFKAKIILKEIEVYNPDIQKYCKKSLKEDLLDLDFQRLDSKEFAKCPEISIDFAVMEKTKKSMVFPLNVGLKDIGSWDAVWEIAKNGDGNVIQGNVITKDTSNSYLRSENRLIATIGIKDLIIVETRMLF